MNMYINNHQKGFVKEVINNQMDGATFPMLYTHGDMVTRCMKAWMYGVEGKVFEEFRAMHLQDEFSDVPCNQSLVVRFDASDMLMTPEEIMKKIEIFKGRKIDVLMFPMSAQEGWYGTYYNDLKAVVLPAVADDSIISFYYKNRP